MRYVLPILVLLGVLAGLGFIKGSQISMLIRAGKEGQKAGPPPEVVSTSVARKDVWEETLSSVGTVAAAKGVTVSNDAPGVVSAILFESGAMVKQGQVLVILDNTVEQAQLASAQARRELATVNVGRTRTLVQSESLPKAQLDSDEAVVKTSRADLNALQAQIDRKIVRAPFSGRLGIRSINLGQYLNPGTPITVLEAMDSVYVDFSVPQQHLSEVSVGTPVRVIVEGADAGAIEGAIAAIDPAIDSMTRSVKLRAGVPNKNDALRPGMFVRIAVVLPQKKTVVIVPAMAVVHASYGDSIFVVETTTARQQFVRLGESRGDFVAIEDGIKEGDPIVVAGGFKLHNGSAITVNNDVKVSPEIDPHPENR